MLPEARSVEVVIPFENLAFPFTSNVKLGDVVAIPTFPPVVNMLAIVLLFPIADNALDASITPADIFVFVILVDVMFIVVKVPPTTKLPDKLSEPPERVVADTKFAPIELETKLLIDALVTTN